jgi:cysteine desulfurase/selenocysteine lyase
MRQDRVAIQHHEQQLLDRARSELSGLPGVELFGRASDRAAVIPFIVDGVHPHDLASLLDQDGVCIRAGHHCTQPLHRHLGVTATARASIGPYTTQADITTLAAAVQRAQEVFA